jgi:hypothetical protein
VVGFIKRLLPRRQPPPRPYEWIGFPKDGG